jgi:hypothetical protein
LERNPFVFWLVLFLLIIFLITLASVSVDKEEASDTKIIFPVPGMITKCPLHTKDAVKECHSTPNDQVDDVLSLLDQPGTYVIRLR